LFFRRDPFNQLPDPRHAGTKKLQNKCRITSDATKER
jgi:hypothetical protein